MQFRRCTIDDIQAAIAKVNADKGYDLEFAYTSGGGGNFRGRLLPTTSHDKGARRTHSGRRLRAACWHAHRDVLHELFTQVPNAKVITAMATYIGMDGFNDWFAMTGAVNSGSLAEPRRYDDLCDCEE